MSFLRLPNIKIAAILMLGLFIYDIFWVFYSAPIFGSNVMISVATQIELPMKYVIPKSFFNHEEKYSMLGLGDMVSKMCKAHIQFAKKQRLYQECFFHLRIELMLFEKIRVCAFTHF